MRLDSPADGGNRASTQATAWWVKLALSFALALSSLSPAFAQGGIDGTTALVPNADTLSFRQIRQAEREIAAAVVAYESSPEPQRREYESRLAEALRSLQQVHDATFGLNHVTVMTPPASRRESAREPVWQQYARVLRAGREEGADRDAKVGPRSDLSSLASQVAGVDDVYVSVTEYITAIFRSLPDPMGEIYRREFDLGANSAFELAFATGDPGALRAVARRFPLSSSAPTAAILAGDLFYERGQMFLAARAWDDVEARTFDAVRIASEGDATSLLGRIEWKDLWSRRLRAAVATRSKDSYVAILGEIKKAGLVDSIPTSLMPQSSAIVPWETPSSESELAHLPEVTFDRLAPDSLWKTVEFDVKRVRVGAVPFMSPPVVHLPDGRSPWVAVNTSRRLMRFDLETGLYLEGHEFSKRQGRGSVSGFVEDDERVRLEPVIATPSNARSPYMIGTYVRGVSEASDYAGYQITEKLPQRAIRCVSTGGSHSPTVWDTSVRAVKRTDPLLAKLSFNAGMAVSGDRLYALGWRQAGYVEAYLVCLDVHTGEALWKSLLVGNQIELTMFGEIAFEPFLGQILVHRDRVLVSTNLGVVASLQAHTGEIEWISPYRSQVQRPARQSMFRAQTRSSIWERNPIVVVGDRVFATPLDSKQLLGFDLETGRRMTAVDGRGLGRFLLGAHGPHLIFAGPNVITAVVARNPGKPVWSTKVTGLDARPALVRGGVVFSTNRGIGHQDLFGERQRSLFSFPRRRSQRRSLAIAHGEVRVVGDRVLVSNTAQLRCYRGTSDR